MSQVTQLLSAAEKGDAGAAERLLPLIYEELRRLASRKMEGERQDHTLQPTALVHEAYLRLVAREERGAAAGWNDRNHFFACAAQAMRRILIESARRKKTAKRGGDHVRAPFDESCFADGSPPEHLLAVDEALTKLSAEAPELARLVELRYFAGMTGKEVAEMQGVSLSTVNRQWACARAWLYREISEG